MKIRRRCLPQGWYPADKQHTRLKIKSLIKDLTRALHKAKAGIVPHAGWDYSGKIALETFNNLEKDHDTIIIIGGHLGPGMGILAAYEEAYETPLGEIPADLEFLNALKTEINIDEDINPDNTVEIQLPFIKYLYPQSRVLWLRAAPAEVSIKLGLALKNAATKLRRKIVVVGSTDLTHYGLNYGFSPHGSGEKAVKWVKNVNDKRFIDAILQFELNKAISLALNEQSACSAGGAVAATSFARQMGIKQGVLLKYLTSYDIFPHDSFVGYAGIIFE